MYTIHFVYRTPHTAHRTPHTAHRTPHTITMFSNGRTICLLNNQEVGEIHIQTRDTVHNVYRIRMDYPGERI